MKRNYQRFSDRVIKKVQELGEYSAMGAKQRQRHKCQMVVRAE